MRVQKLLKSRKLAWIALAVVIAILSMTLLNGIFTSPKTYSKTIQTLDKQKGIATTLSISVAAASTALSAIPSDTGSPIAEELADLTLPLFIVVCILYLEKFLLTSFGWISCSILVPLACLFFSINVVRKNEKLEKYIKKLVILALAIVLIIPASTTVTTHVQETFSESISMAFAEIESISGEGTDEEETGNAIAKFFSELKDDAVVLVQTAKNMLGIFVDAIAVLLITSCIMPILTVAIFIWIIKNLFAVEVPIHGLVKLVIPARKRLLEIEDREEVS